MTHLLCVTEWNYFRIVPNLADKLISYAYQSAKCVTLKLCIFITYFTFKAIEKWNHSLYGGLCFYGSQHAVNMIIYTRQIMYYAE